MMTGMGTGTDRQQYDMTKMAVAAVHSEGDNEDGTRTEGAGNRYSAI